ncbi:MAG: hypothetical protein ABFS03_11150 [Chloroflexota bacterium]
MVNRNHSLWQLLLLTSDSEKVVSLTCEQCFALLEYDADLLIAGADPDDIRPSVSHHLELCSSCKGQIENWLENYKENTTFSKF